MHGIRKSNVKLRTILSLLQFLRSEGKADLDGNGEPMSSFEYNIFNNVHTVLEKQCLTTEEKVLSGLVLTEIEPYDESYLKNVLLPCDLSEILLVCHTIYMFSEKNKPLIQMLALEKITDQNSDRIELEIEKKLSWFARKLSKMTQIKLKVRHSTISKCKFDLVVYPSMIGVQLAEAIIKKHNSIAGTSETDLNILRIKISEGREIWINNCKTSSLKKFGFADKTAVTYWME